MKLFSNGDVTDLAIYLIGGLSTIAETPRYMRVIPSIPEADGAGWIEVPSVTSTSTVAKWTLRNEEWVQVLFAIHQGANMPQPSSPPSRRTTRD